MEIQVAFMYCRPVTKSGQNLGFVLIGQHRIGQRGDGNQQVFLAHNQRCGVQGCQLKAVSVRDGIRWAGLNAVTAEDAAVVVNVVDLGVTLRARDALLFRILRCLDVDAVGGAGSCAQKTGDAFFQAILVALELMLAAEALLKLRAAHRTFAVRIVLDFRRLEHLLQRDTHSLGNSSSVANDGHRSSIAESQPIELTPPTLPGTSVACAAAELTSF